VELEDHAARGPWVNSISTHRRVPCARIAPGYSSSFTIVSFDGDGGRLVGIAAVMRDMRERFDAMKPLRTVVAVAATTQ
jgi:hypothetical protein